MGNNIRQNHESNLDDAPLSEVMLVVRPEDKAAISRVLEGELGCGFTSHHAVGRGFDGGLSYGANTNRSWLIKWANRPPVLSFLPKIVFWVVLPTSRTDVLIEKVGAAVRLNGGPTQCAGGFAVVAEIEQQFPMGITPGSGASPTFASDGVSMESSVECVLI